MTKKFKDVTLPATVGETLASFGCTCLFGICALPLIFELRVLIPHLLRKWLPLKYAGDMYVIATVLVAGIAWMVLFMVLWNRLEKMRTYKRRVIVTLIWCGAALLALSAVIGLEMLLTL